MTATTAPARHQASTNEARARAARRTHARLRDLRRRPTGRSSSSSTAPRRAASPARPACPPRRMGVRLVAPDRPGTRRSTAAPQRGIADWPADHAALLDALGARAGRHPRAVRRHAVRDRRRRGAARAHDRDRLARTDRALRRPGVGEGARRRAAGGRPALEARAVAAEGRPAPLRAGRREGSAEDGAQARRGTAAGGRPRARGPGAVGDPRAGDGGDPRRDAARSPASSGSWRARGASIRRTSACL